MIKKFIPLLVMLLVFSNCSASSAKSKGKSKSRKPVKTEQTTTQLPDTTLMISKNIPEGSVEVLVHTTLGDFTVLLYGDTPRHRDNFLKLVKNGDYDGVLFHRVIKDFMVQTGDPDSKEAGKDKHLGAGDVGERIPAEIVFPTHFHKRGALAAARQGDAVNPERMSSGSQFYVVTGKVFNDNQLNQMNMRLRQSVGQNHFNELAQQHIDEIRQMQKDGDSEGLMKLQEELSQKTNKWLEENPVGMTPEMIETYKTIGGTPHLDNEYTVFGEVISGMSTIDKIQKVETGAADRPVDDVRVISMKVIEK